MVEKVKTSAANYPLLPQFRNTIINGFPNDKCHLPQSLRPFWNVRHQLAIDDTDDWIVNGTRLMILKALQIAILQDLLLIQEGSTKVRQRARILTQ